MTPALLTASKIENDSIDEMDPGMASLLRLKLGMPYHPPANQLTATHAKRAHSSLMTDQHQLKEWGEVTRYLQERDQE